MDNNTAVAATVSLFKSAEFERLSKEIDKLSNDLRHKRQEIANLHKYLEGKSHTLGELNDLLLNFSGTITVEYQRLQYSDFRVPTFKEHILMNRTNTWSGAKVLPFSTVVKVVSIVPDVGPQ